MGGEGGMMGGMEQPIEERCPDAQAEPISRFS